MVLEAVSHDVDGLTDQRRRARAGTGLASVINLQHLKNVDFASLLCF